ncbi:leucine-rich repeat domain-containing protein [Bacteroides xylanisolvens]|uniref:leucine-rich repeat domain-containing protein n=1 Tax=Bacteroides xylanisolvens TaxID=371601 RepID=UPI0022E6C49B|nr:leucine-rich repeat domain-containing protein [Bacteroides xylanisolvens]
MRFNYDNKISGNGLRLGKLFLGLFLLSASFQSCDDVKEYPTDYPGKRDNITLNFEAQLPDGKQWSNTDIISVFDTYGVNSKFSTDIESPAAIAGFKGNVVESESYIAVYPYSQDMKIADGIVQLNLPASISAVEASSQSSRIYYAQVNNSSDDVVSFTALDKKVTLKMTAENTSDVKSLSVQNKSGIPFAGTFYLNVKDGSIVPSSTSSYSHAVIEGEFAKDASYSIPVVSSENLFSGGVVVTFTNAEGKKAMQDLTVDDNLVLADITEINFEDPEDPDWPVDPEEPETTEYYIVYKADEQLVPQAEFLTHLYDAEKKEGTVYFSTSEVPANLFKSDKKIIGVTFSPTITKINANAFNGCTSLVEINFAPEGQLNDILNNAFTGCTGFTGTLVIPNSVTNIAQAVFKNMSNMSGLEIGTESRLWNVGYDCFNGCNSIANKVVLPATLTKIGGLAFGGEKKSGAFEIEIHATTVPSTFGTNAFPKNTLKAIYVPAESVDAYKALPNLSQYKEKIKAIGSN